MLKKYFIDFRYFFSFLGYRIFISFALSIGVAIMDGLGLAMFLPLLEVVDGELGTSKGLGKLGFLVDWLNKIGLSLDLKTVLSVMLLFFILKGVFKFLEGYYKVLLQRHFIRTLRFSQLELLANLDYKSFVQSDSGKIQNTVSGEVGRVLAAYNAYFFSTQGAVMILVYMALAFTVNAQFTILVIIGGGLSNLIYSRIFNLTKSISSKLTNSNHEFQGLVIQKVALFKYLKATGTIKAYSGKLREKVLEIEGFLSQMGLLNAGINAIREPLVIFVVVLVIFVEVNWMGGRLGLILLSLIFFYRSLTYLMNMQNYWNTYLGNHGSLTNMKKFLEELSIGQEQNGTIQFDRFKNKLCISDVSFAYDKTSILKNINLIISKNETIAFVGESGSGKTTLMNIISGLVYPNNGIVTVDGVLLQHLNKESFQKRLGYITQDPVIFDDSIFNNVTFWDQPTPENLERFWEALRKAAILEFVKGLPKIEQTRLGNNGIMVSGGQKQRISIARELYKKIDFLLMDEATSALDSETEFTIQEHIAFLKGSVTIIIIAHRLSTVKFADRVVILKAGKIQGIGDFESLMESTEEFRKMVEIQEF
ncbi:ABC transporter ATP-binding protein [Cyclobacterium plantarum]|uniref:ABC transporter ATP-binding protein n=1 Tax=Cyclobacterium plantarum TaxID=2716263 RepID=UPI003F6ED8AA